MTRFLSALLYLTLIGVSCAPQSITQSVADISSPLVVSAHAPEIRFALIGSPRDVNTWALFDEAGASYVDYALRSEYFPRLYHLVPPEFSQQPLAAQGRPSEMIQEGEFYSATVNLRSDLKWTDGSPFTADDIAFTANTALAFDLGFDWRTSYSRDYLDHVEVVNSHVIKFVFKQKPNVGVWQYGALQGPIVQKKFWQSRLTKAEELLPGTALSDDIEKARASLATSQYDVADLTAKLAAVRESGHGNREIEINLAQRQLELGYAKNNLNKALENHQITLSTARQALYDLDDKNEPTLGAWVFESKKGDVWVNAANSAFPFGKLNFDRAVYHIFDNETDALAAFAKNEVDFILSQNGISHAVKDTKVNATYNARFLVFNPSQTQFADPAFHSALSCMIDREELARNVLQNKAAPLNSFIISSQWRNPKVSDPCAGMNKSDRVDYAVKLLKDSGYSWMQQPDKKNAGKNLIQPNDESFPKITLSAPSKSADALRYAAAKYIAAQAQYLGIPFSVREMSVDDVVYAAYSSQKYDAALIGWRLSEYPGYVCEWFGGKNPYLFSGSKFASKCDALGGESNLEAARLSFHQVESELMSELPFIPLFTLTRMEVYQNLAYPTTGVWNGWHSLYGAPSYTIPTP